MTQTGGWRQLAMQAGCSANVHLALTRHRYKAMLLCDSKFLASSDGHL